MALIVATHLTILQIYAFLIKFPVYDVLMANFESEEISYKEVFPPGLPFKSLYAIYALREYIRTQLQNVGIFPAQMAYSLTFARGVSTKAL